MYLTLLLIGVIGYIALLVMGVSHGGRSSGQEHSIHGAAKGAGRLGHSHGVAKGAHPVKVHSHGKAASVGKSIFRFLALSPMDIFSLAMGAGGVGIAFAKLIPDPVKLGIAATIGALVFTYGVVKPLSGFVMQWASNPSEGLEGLVSKSVTADANFDPHGKGVVVANIDGQLVRCLARLVPNEVGQSVCKNTILHVVEIDPKSSACIVTAELSFDINEHRIIE